MHVVVSVFRKSSTKNNIAFSICQFLVFFKSSCIFSIINRVIWFLFGSPLLGIFFSYNCFLLSTKFKMLVFNNSCKRNFSLSIINHSTTLVVVRVVHLMVELKTTILKLSELKIIILVNFASKYYFVSESVPFFTVFKIINFQLDFYTVK